MRTHRLWWNVSASSCSRRPESCTRKSLGARGWPRSEPTLDNPTSFVPWTPTLGPGLLPHCPITAGCSHKGAKARPVKLTHSQGHVPAENTQLSAEPCLAPSQASPGSAYHLVSGSTLTIRCRLRCRSQYSSSRWDERCMTWQARRLGVLGSGVTITLKQCISARPPADTTLAVRPGRGS